MNRKKSPKNGFQRLASLFEEITVNCSIIQVIVYKHNDCKSIFNCVSKNFNNFFPTLNTKIKNDILKVRPKNVDLKYLHMKGFFKTAFGE